MYSCHLQLIYASSSQPLRGKCRSHEEIMIPPNAHHGPRMQTKRTSTSWLAIFTFYDNNGRVTTKANKETEYLTTSYQSLGGQQRQLAQTIFVFRGVAFVVGKRFRFIPPQRQGFGNVGCVVRRALAFDGSF